MPPFPWTRMWLHSDGNALPDGARQDGYFEGESRGGRELRELLSTPCLVLLAPPGYGKSQEMRNLVSRIAGDFPEETWLPLVEGMWLTSELDLRRLTLGSNACMATLNAGRSIRLVIDALDDALRNYPRVLLDLIALLQRAPLERVRLIVTCRTAVWPTATGDRLMKLWPSVRETELSGALHFLAPLRREDVEQAAQLRSLDVQRFMAEIHTRRFEALAAQPLTLRLMLDLMGEQLTLPTTRWELFERAVRLLCEEPDVERAERMRLPHNADDLHAAAERVAALMMVTGQPTLAAETSEELATVRSLTFDQVRGEERTVNGRVSIDRVLLRHLVDTGLFTLARSGIFVVYHASFMEHLAAAYFAGPKGTHFTVEQLRQILCDRVGEIEMVVPALTEVAAELAGVHDGWRAYLGAMHPQVFLHADLSSLSAPARADAVDAVLRGAEENRISDGSNTGRFLWSFAHGGLTNQLRPYLENASRPYIARRLAFRIAGACQLSELEALMWKRAEVRDPCVNELGHALGKLAGPASIPFFKRVLRGEIEDDGFMTLRGVALAYLVPAVMPVREVAGELIPPTEFMAGAYKHFLTFEIEHFVTREDLSTLLPYFAKIAADNLSFRLSLALATIRQALAVLTTDAQVAKDMAGLWLTLVARHVLPTRRSWKKETDPWQKLEEDTTRRALIVSVLDHPNLQMGDYAIVFEKLVRPVDACWLLGELRRWRGARRVKAAELYATLPNARTCENRRALRSVAGEVRPVLRERLLAMAKIERRRRANRRKCDRNEKSAWQEEARQLQRRLAAMWQLVGNGDPRGWSAFYTLSELPMHQPERTCGGDQIEDALLWRNASEQQRTLLLAAAEAFLCQRTPRTSLTTAEMAGHAAILLLRKLIPTRPRLRSAVKKKWVALVLDWYDSHEELVALMHQLAPEACQKWWRQVLARGARDTELRIAFGQWRRAWTPKLSRLLITRVSEAPLPGGELVRCVRFLTEVDTAGAQELMHRLEKRSEGKPGENAELGRTLLIVQLFVLPEDRGDAAVAALRNLPAEAAREVLATAMRHYHVETDDILARLSDEGIADLYLWMHELQSPHQDPGNGPHGFVTAGHQIADLRNALLNQLTSRATPSSGEALLRVAAEVPEDSKPWVWWKYREAIATAVAAQRSASPWTAERFLHVARNANASVVETADQLAVALVASLDRLQTMLRETTSVWFLAMWNELAGKWSPKHEEAISDIIHDWFKNGDPHLVTGAIYNREPQTKRLNYLDIKVELVRRGERGEGFDTLLAIVEVKGAWHREVTTSLGEQLVGRYLKTEGGHGLYLVVWFGKEHTGSSWRPATVAEARRDVERWSEDQTPQGFRVVPYVLDATQGLPARAKIAPAL